MQRNDVQRVYPGIANAELSGFKAQFQLASVYAHDTIQFISRWTNNPEGNGDFVDYWFDPVQKNNRGFLDSWNLSSGQVAVSGWHANDASLYQPYHYLILFDLTAGQQVIAEQVPTELSEDVSAVYPDTYSAGHCRFNYLFTGDYHLFSGHTYQLVSRYSTFNQGNGDNGAADYTDYWFPAYTLNRQNGYLDSFNINADNQLHITGWMANDAILKYRIPYAIVLTNGNRELVRQKLTLTQRLDVANAEPTIVQSLVSGFDTVVQLPSDAVSGDLQVVLRFSDSENGEGSYSDNWLPVIKNGLQRNRLVKQGVQLFYYDDHGQRLYNFIIDGVLYRTDAAGNVLNRFTPDHFSIGNLTFTGNLTGINKNNRRPVQLKITMKDGTIINAWATVKWQGNSTLLWPKKGYRLKLFKDEALTDKLKIALPGSGFKTNSFNLKACFTDPTAGLNIVNAKLFSDITASRSGLSASLVDTMPNYGQVVGLPLELGINGLDQGLYVLETYQEDKLYNLDDKVKDNYEICGNGYTPVTQFAQKALMNNFEDTDFQVKSPVKFSQAGVDHFNKLYQLANSDDHTYYQLENQYLDVPAAVDYLAFLIAINSTDSLGKNITYISKNGSKWVVIPYDLDTTWDNNFDGTIMDINNNLIQSLPANRLLEVFYNHHRQEVINRYRQLRQTTLSTANVTNEFNKWFEMVGSNAYSNNDQLWGDINTPGYTHRLSVSIDTFDQMIAQRLNIVDRQLGLA